MAFDAHTHTHICVHGLLTVVIGLYYWTYHYAPEGWKRFLSFLIAYANTLGNIGGVCSINYGVSCDALWVPCCALWLTFASAP